MQPAPGELFDRYRIEELLGEGGMGRVYRAFDERLQRRVALKILHLNDAPRPTASRPMTDGASRLLREARAAAAIDHPNAVAIFDVGEARGADDAASVPFIAMELIEGRSLRAFIGAEGVSIAERIRWLADIARAIHAAHERNLVHRDIKPENVMIRSDGLVKVLDFGIARRAPSGKIDPNAATQASAVIETLTAEGLVVGTPYYMAPEQMRGEAIDGRADQFSWGVVAYELLTGKLPWDREGDSLKLVSEVLTKQPASIRALVPEVPVHVEAAILRALAKAPGDRLASMAVVVENIQGSAATGPRAAPQVAEVLGTAATILSTRTSLAAARSGAVDVEPNRKWRTSRVAAVALGTLVAGSMIVLAVQHRTRVAVVAVDAAAQPGPTAIMDLPPPKTTPEALAAYEDAMRARRDGDNDRFGKESMHAVTLDPNLAPALMRLAVALIDFAPERAREFFSRAVELRRTLTPRDQAFLDAFEPYVQRDPADPAETFTRLQALAARYPMDAEIVFDLGQADDHLGHNDEALAEYQRATELDPGFVLPLVGKIGLLAGGKGDFAGALAAAKACEALAPGDPGCFFTRDQIHVQEGRCADLQEDARRLMTRRPSSQLGYIFSAEALSTLGSPMGSIREVVTQARARMSDGDKAWIPVALFDVHMAELEGDFAKAGALAREREAQPSVTGSVDESVHGTVAWERYELATETGKTNEATAVAADFRSRRAAWTRSPSRVPGMIGFDRSLALLSVLARAGRIPRRELEDARNDWLQSWKASGPKSAAPYEWIGAYAWGVATPEAAREALEALPSYEPFPKLWDFATDFAIGKVYFLAGRVDEAIPYLTRATKSCNALDAPFDHVRAHLVLGQALESKSDVAGACAAYRAVGDRWGQATPRSVTADAARARATALGCDR